MTDLQPLKNFLPNDIMLNLTPVTTPTTSTSTCDCNNCNGICTLPFRYDRDGVICKYGGARLNRRQFEKAKIPAKYCGKTFADYQVTADNQRAVALAKRFIVEKPAQGLYLYGDCGTGKTYLASIIAQSFIRSDKSVIFGDIPDLMSRLKETFDKGGTEILLKRYCTCDLLILDDIGTGQITTWNIGILYQIVNARYNAAKTIIATSNYDLNDLTNVLSKGDWLTGKRITSRLQEMTLQAFLGTEDRRRSNFGQKNNAL